MKITPAFRKYVRRVERQALAGRLDAIRTLGAIAIALSTMTIPGHADSMLGTLPKASPPLGATASVPPSTSTEHWTIRTLLAIKGKFVASAQYGEQTFPDGASCQKAVLADAQLKTTVADIGAAAVKRYGAGATIVVTCAMDLQ